MELAELSMGEVEAYLRRRRDVLLPVGSLEEHGYHLPLGTDTMIAVAVCREASRRTGIACAPPVWYNFSRSTRGYAGTVMTGREELKRYVAGVLQGLAESGFRRIVVVPGHFSRASVEALEEACAGAEVDAGVFDFSSLSFSDILETQPMHACEAETSLMLYLHPEAVRMELAVDEEIAVEGDMLRRTKSGVFGTPSRASAEKGRAIFERIVAELCRCLGKG
ncbi:MAG: creatininase family protein [Euryarchaeota archaeon]|nr:creatininase family protein [Euryarchaeota archaeon]